MSWVTPRKRDAHAAELPNRHEKLQAELRELLLVQAQYQEKTPVFERQLEEVNSFRVGFLNQLVSGTQEEKALADLRLKQAEALANDVNKLWTNLSERRRTTSARIEEIECELKELSRPYIDRVLQVGPPSQAEKEGLYKIQTCGGQPLYDCCLPADAQLPLPLTLVHPVFAEFCDDFSDASVPLDDSVCQFVLDLCYNVLGRMDRYEDEVQLNLALNRLLSKFLGGVVAMDSINYGGRTARVDGMLQTVHGKLKALLELKLDNGSTLVQGLQTFGIYSGAEDKKAELLPCFFIETIGPTIRIGGLVLFERVAWQPLTPFMNCFYTEHDQKDMVTLCRAMRVLKRGVIALEDYYNVRVSCNTITPKDVPYPLQEKQCVRRIGNKLVFIVTLDSGVQIFKYCRQYGEEVHRSWASAGLAPCLHGCKPIAGGWLEVRMQFLEDYNNAFSLLRDMDGAAKHQLQAAVLKAWTQASAIQVGGCLVAHGDMRPPNVMVRRDVRRRRDSWEIKFIDFDWAGKVGVARYPPFMNKALPWHPDVGAGTLLEQCHDKWCVEQEAFWKVV